MLKIDLDTCIGCGVCEANCAFGAITMEDGRPVVNEKCTLCGTCVDNCEPGAMAIEREAKAQQVDLAAWSGVWVFAEYRHGRIAPVALELLGAGRALADTRGVKLGAVLFGDKLGAAASDLVAHGADTVYAADNPAFAHFTDDAYGNVLADLIREHRPEIVLAGATAIGRSVIPRVATILGAGLTADCTDLAIRAEDGALLQTRPAFGGNIMATIVCPDTRPQMATVRPLVMKPLSRDDARQGEIVAVSPAAERL
ncbi:MAG: electron transfer flavoprotein subunit alpha, partial [Desulfobulbaceae bacterium]|nr:electron transfer flavoprotein subunit alpha [Desulfobulbaceae bacterium]